MRDHENSNYRVFAAEHMEDIVIFCGNLVNLGAHSFVSGSALEFGPLYGVLLREGVVVQKSEGRRCDL